MNNTSKAIGLLVQGMGHVPSFKNSKSLFKNKKTGKLFVATNPKKKQWMEAAISSIESQLSGLFPIREGETLGECQKRLLTASCLPLDDSLDWMIPGPQSVKKVNKGEEGCVILIEEI